MSLNAHPFIFKSLQNECFGLEWDLEIIENWSYLNLAVKKSSFHQSMGVLSTSMSLFGCFEIQSYCVNIFQAMDGLIDILCRHTVH